MLLSWCSFTTQFSLPSWRCRVCHQCKVTQASPPSPSHPQPPVAPDQESHQLGASVKAQCSSGLGYFAARTESRPKAPGSRTDTGVSTDGQGEQGEIHFWKRQHLSSVRDRSSLPAQAAPLAGCAPCRAPGASTKGFLRGRLTLAAGLRCAGFPSGDAPLSVGAMGWQSAHQCSQIFILTRDFLFPSTVAQVSPFSRHDPTVCCTQLKRQWEIQTQCNKATGICLS